MCVQIVIICMHKTGTTKITSVLNTMKRTVLENTPHALHRRNV